MKLLYLSVLVPGLALLVALSRPPAPPLRTEEGPMLPRVQLLHALGASQQSLVADYFWIQMIQQMGRAQTGVEFRDIYPYADLVTSLDPAFHVIYTYGAVAIPFNEGREHWVNVDESTALIHKGLQRFPGDFELRFYLAYNLQYFHKRLREAAELVEEMSHDPKAPPFLAPLATRLFAQAGEFQAGIALAQALRDSAKDEESRKFFEHRILELEEEHVLQDLDKVVSAFRARERRLPLSVEELVVQGDLPTLPKDPLGGTLSIDDKGNAQSSAAGHRLRLYYVAKEEEQNQP